jgi:uncharacterized membrane protein YqgA involved in biofilm formation
MPHRSASLEFNGDMQMKRFAFLFRPEVLNELSGTGGLLMLASGFLVFQGKRLRVASLLPALVVAVVLTAVRLTLGW